MGIDAAEHARAVNAGWAEREAFFRESPHSPIPPGERAAFKAIPRYPVDPAYRFVLELEKPPEGLVERMGSTGGDPREYPVLGIARFELAGRPVSLHILRIEGDAWVPFRDATSGNETYGAGRYLDVDRLPDGRAVLDFNYAYHPFCAYNDDYSCALPPPANRLDVPVRAGERL